MALREVSWALSKTETPDPNTLATCDGLIWILAKATTNQTRLPVINAVGENLNRSSFASLRGEADLLARRAAEISWSENFAPTLLRSLAATDSEFVVSKDATILFHRAERLVRDLSAYLSQIDANQGSRRNLRFFSKMSA